MSAANGRTPAVFDVDAPFTSSRSLALAHRTADAEQDDNELRMMMVSLFMRCILEGPW
jgi:hypothetical protein